VPSDVVNAIDRMFPEMAMDPNAFPQLSVDQLPWLIALANLVEAVLKGGSTSSGDSPQDDD